MSSSLPWPWGVDDITKKPKPTHGFILTGSLKDKVENHYTEGPTDTCFCLPTNDLHKEWCVYGEEYSHEGSTKDHLLTIDGWRLSKVHYNDKAYGGIIVPDRYEVTHSCPVALWRVEMVVEDGIVESCRACCCNAPDELIAVYLLHKG